MGLGRLGRAALADLSRVRAQDWGSLLDAYEAVTALNRKRLLALVVVPEARQEVSLVHKLLDGRTSPRLVDAIENQRTNRILWVAQTSGGAHHYSRGAIPHAAQSDDSQGCPYRYLSLAPCFFHAA